ncbi:hypothetical protein [Roseiflexus sp.]|uniref:hypothetical protein n=1 Tax=Roseiflexus sp. TaxID=2562120 RepID=UPI00398BB27D
MRSMIVALLVWTLLLAACGSAGTGAAPPQPAQALNPAPEQPTQPPAATGIPGQVVIVDPTVAPTGSAAIPAATPVPTAAPREETPMPTPDQGNEPVRPMPPYSAQPLTPPFGAAMDAQIDAARQDLAQRLRIDASAIEVVQVEAVTWPDASLGCPKPGMMYPQVLVDGILLQLRANGQIYRYHGDGQNRMFLCDPQAGPQIGGATRPPRGDP